MKVFSRLSPLYKQGLLALIFSLSFIVTVIWPAVSVGQTPTPFPTDIQGYWAQQCVQYVVGEGMMETFVDGTFRPNLPVTRGKFSDIIVKAFPDAPVVRDYVNEYFIDIPETYWAMGSIRKAYEVNFLSGYPERIFAPLQNIPRVQVLVAFASGFSYTQPYQNAQSLLTSVFTDAAAIPGYARDYVAAATENGLAVSFPNPNELKPNQWATRGEIAAFLCQAKASPSMIPSQYIVKPISPGA